MRIIRNIMKVIKWIPRIWKIQPWDFGFIYMLNKWHLEDMIESFENQRMVDPTQPITEMKRCVELFNNLDKDDYLSRVGYEILHHEDINKDEFYTKSQEAQELKTKEQDELFSILRNHMETWWW